MQYYQVILELLIHVKSTQPANIVRQLTRPLVFLHRIPSLNTTLDSLEQPYLTGSGEVVGSFLVLSLGNGLRRFQKLRPEDSKLLIPLSTRHAELNSQISITLHAVGLR